jgi:uncharacterized protein YndB with AHSA1/START domain
LSALARHFPVSFAAVQKHVPVLERAALVTKHRRGREHVVHGQLERWWGPPTWPATFERHDFAVGGAPRYYMTGPEGQKARGWWTITAIEAPNRLEFDDGFAGDDGEPLDAMEPIRAVVTLEARGAGTRMTTITTFASTEQLERVLAMGMEAGMRLAMGQIDGVLAGAPH